MARIDQLADEIIRSLREYTEDVSAAAVAEVDNTARELRAELEATSPRNKGDYARGWVIVKDDRRGSTRRIVWNRKHYHLVHLLERGHAKRGGGRVAAQPHVGPAERKYVLQLTDRIRQIIQNGG